jgi:hypothetical protein
MLPKLSAGSDVEDASLFPAPNCAFDSVRFRTESNDGNDHENCDKFSKARPSTDRSLGAEISKSEDEDITRSPWTASSLFSDSVGVDWPDVAVGISDCNVTEPL